MHIPARVRDRSKRDAGFTLIELVVVLAIIGILVAAAIPLYLGSRMKAYKSEADHVLEEVKSLEWGYYEEHNAFATALSTLGFVAPASVNWSFSDPTATGTDVTMLAVGQTTSPVSGQTVSLILHSDGSGYTGATF